ncbi:MAG: alpha-amylase family glycosyl hydrolase [Acidimicrobiia bacterium]
MPDAPNQAVPWWTDAVIYQIYPLSYSDSNGDGSGDLQGIIDRLDYLSNTLGVDGIWLSPFYKSPMKDWGYDVSDHTDVDPVFGDLAAAEALIEAAHAHGLKVVVDYVMNHTSDQHQWFLDSRSSRDDPKRDWYVWRDGDVSSPPNNWLSVFGGKAWTFDPTTEQWYRHSFLTEQPDVNWRNPEAVEAMMDVVRFWLDRGVDGFRVDASHQIMKDPLERDNPPATAAGSGMHKDMREYDSQHHLYDVAHEDVHEGHRIFRAVQDSTDRDILSVGEAHVFDYEEWAAYFGENLDELTMPFSFHLLASPWDAEHLADVIRNVIAHTPEGGVTNWTLGNHDEARLATRLPEGQARLAAILLLTLGGASFLYYGDELGMLQTQIAPGDRRDPWGLAGDDLSRDGARTPMQWTSGPSAGFSSPGVDPWLPLGDDYESVNVETQLADPDSTLNLYRRLLETRKTSPVLRFGDVTVGTAEGDVLRYSRSLVGHPSVEVMLNLGRAEQVVTCEPGSVLVSSHPSTTSNIGPTVTLGVGEGVVVQRHSQ